MKGTRGIPERFVLNLFVFITRPCAVLVRYMDDQQGYLHVLGWSIKLYQSYEK